MEREIKFGSIKHQIPQDKAWRDIIPDDKIVSLKEVPWGHCITSADLAERAEDPSGYYRISFITEGIAEVCEEYEFKPQGGGAGDGRLVCPHAYRPIRHLEVGDFFGDFSLVDRAVFGPATRSRPFENWKLVYGGRSAIFLCSGDATPPKHLFYNSKSGTGTRAVHHLLDRAHSGKKVSIIDVRWRDGEPRFDDFFHGLIRASWKRSYTYRLASNSYNVHHKFVFLRRAAEAIGFFPEQNAGNDRDTDKERTFYPYPFTVGYGLMGAIFLEALYDAINRPVRDEPLFAEVAWLQRGGDLDTALKSGKLLLPARFRKHVSIKKFYFPLGLTNFLVANFAQGIRKIDDVYQAFTSFRPKPFTQQRDGRFHYFDKRTGKRVSSKGNSLHFWKSIADMVLESYCNVDVKKDRDEGFCRSDIEAEYRISVEPFQLFDGRWELFIVYERI
jgi:hypothetical protein